MKTVNVIEAVFFAALEKKSPVDRAAYLDQACGGDPDLRRCVDKLLAAQPRVGDFMQAPAPGLPPTTDTGSTERAGMIIGPYKLLHEIGEGGMGTVWMAEQEQPVKRRVALKVIKPGMDSRQVLARFEAERQALALMDHPNIAKVLDAGAVRAHNADEPEASATARASTVAYASGSSRPYFVMELVKGIPITEFCDKNKLSARERLELFIPVCNAIQHAHHKGVIHRDIKPSNVLVALYDGKPMPKVIDFGVAKAISEPLTDKTLFTRHGQVVGTFEYMSPEQATLDALDVDTRSDIYALGVLLYELLTGTTPLEKDRLRQAGFAEVLRLIREEEPPKPSTRLTSSPGLLATAAAYRKSDSQRLSKEVRGELDWIVMKCLDKDRNRRFATANGLALDIERYLKDEPVTACPPTLGYRLRKWARKHKVAFATTSAIAAALLIGIVLTGWQAVRATNAEQATATALGKAAEERDTAITLGKQLDTRLIDLQAANEKIHLAREEMRRARYAGDMQALPLTWEAGNAAEARQILERQDEGLLGFEWHYWNQQTHAEVASGKLPGLPEDRLSRAGLSGGDWKFSSDGSRIAYLNFSEGSSKPHERTLFVWDAATRKLLLSHQIAVEGLPADANLSSSSSVDFSLSNDGKRMAVAVTCYHPRDGQQGIGGGQGFARPNSEKDRSVIHVIDVDSKKVVFKTGKKEDGEWSTPTARLSRDGRKLLSYTAAVPRVVGGLGRITVWDLDSPNTEPVIIDNTMAGSFSPDGSRVHATARIGESARGPKAWDAATGKELPDFSYAGVPSPKGKYVASVPLVGEGEYKTRTLKLYDGATRKELMSTPLTGALEGQTPRGGPELWPLTFSPDESLVAVPHHSTSGTPRIDWYIVETKNGQILRTLEDPAPPTRGSGFAGPRRGRGERFFSHDGKQFICVVDNAIHALNVAPGRPARTFRGHLNTIVAAAAVPDQRLRTLESNGTLKEWDLQPPKVPAPIAAVEVDRQGGSGPSVTARIGYSVAAGGGHVACVDRGRGENPYTVHVWDVAGNRSTTFDAGPFKAGFFAGSQELRLSADGKRVALSRVDPRGGAGWVGKVDPQNPPLPPDLTVWEWDAATGASKLLLHREFPRADGNAGMRDFLKNGTTILLSRLEKVGTLPDGRVRYRTTLWTIDVDTGREGRSIVIDGSVTTSGGCLSPDGTRFAGFVRTPATDGSWNDVFTVWDLVRGTQVFAVAPIKLVLVGNVNVATGPGAALWSPDGSRVAVLGGPGDGSIALYDAATGKLVRTLNTSTRSSSVPLTPRIAFSPDGRRIACEIRQRSGGGAISVLDTESGQEVLSLSLPPGFALGSPLEEVSGARLTFSPDGHRLLLFRRVQNVSAEIDGKLVPATALRVHTWDATPRAALPHAPDGDRPGTRRRLRRAPASRHWHGAARPATRSGHRQ
jgi:serine/threonine protein kinase/WD40 repeat protein